MYTNFVKFSSNKNKDIETDFVLSMIRLLNNYCNY